MEDEEEEDEEEEEEEEEEKEEEEKEEEEKEDEDEGEGEETEEDVISLSSPLCDLSLFPLLSILLLCSTFIAFFSRAPFFLLPSSFHWLRRDGNKFLVMENASPFFFALLLPITFVQEDT